MCLHHYKDMNSIYLLSLGNMSLEHFIEIFLYVKNVDISINKLVQLADVVCAKPYIYYCLWYTNQIFDDPLLANLLPFFATPVGISLITTYGLSSKERHPWKIDFFDRLFSVEFKRVFNMDLDQRLQDKRTINSRFII